LGIEAGGSPSRGLDWRTALVAGLAFTGLSLLLLEPALRGPIVSDDVLLFVGRPWIEGVSAENLETILDPRGEPVEITANWAPLHLFAHQLEYALFGSPLQNSYPYHVVNGLAHAANALLFAALLAAFGLPVAGALAAGLVFLVHPANVETAAWMFQLKTLLAFGLGMGALLWLRRRPAAATLLFGLALLAKPSAAAVLAAALVFEWQRRPAPGEPPRRFGWLAGWGALLALYALPELAAFRQIGEFRDTLPPATQALQAVAILGRYLVLATTSLGASAFHQPTPPASPGDPWFLLGLVTLLVLGAASLRALARGHPAAGWLGLAVAGYLPIAQLFPFRYSMADRYLYFVLPGLLGALLAAGAPWLARALAGVRERGLAAAPAGLVALALAVPVLAAVFALRFHARAELWSSPVLLESDAAAHYPDGIPGQITLARQRIAQGDLEGAVDALERARARGYSNPSALIHDPSFQALYAVPRYGEMLRDMTERWIERFATFEDPSVANLIGLAQAELFMGRADRAREALARAEAKADERERLVVQQMRRDLEVAIRELETATP
jgi:hypothetical protein